MGQAISNPEIEAIDKVINSSEKEIDLWGNKITEEGAKYLAEAIIDNKRTLTAIGLDYNEITETGAMYLAEALEKNQTVTVLYLGVNQIADKGLKYLSEALKFNNTLTKINLEQNFITDVGAKFFAETLKINKSLLWINLEKNLIQERGARYLSEALILNNNLTWLNLATNNITDIAARSLARTLEKNKSLRVLNLNDNLITDKGVKYLAMSLENNKTLTGLHLNGNKITDTGAKSLADTLVKNEALIILNLFGNEITDTGVKSLAEAIEKNQNLIELDLHDNLITDTGANYLAQALDKNNTLTWIGLDRNEITEKFKEMVKSLLIKNKNKGMTDVTSGTAGISVISGIAEIDVEEKFENFVNDANSVTNSKFSNLQEESKVDSRRKQEQEPELGFDKINLNDFNDFNNLNENILKIRSKTLQEKLLNNTIIDNKHFIFLEKFKANMNEIKFKLDFNKKKIIIYGKGTIGTVYLADYKGSEVAVKKISLDRQTRLALLMELDLMFKIRHPNINTLIAYAEDEDSLYVLTKYFKLGDLFKVLNNKYLTLTIKMKLEILLQISSAVKYLHEFFPPILHRDIKSLNVLVSSDLSRVYLNYFGIYNDFTESKKSEEVCLSWKAPELFNKCEGEPDLTTDVFSFGILMWEVLTRKIPYQEKENNEVIVKNVLMGNRPDLADVPQSTPVEVKVLMQKCWEQNPSNRPSMKEVTDNLESIIAIINIKY